MLMQDDHGNTFELSIAPEPGVDLNGPALADKLLADAKGKLPLKIFEQHVIRSAKSSTASGLNVEMRTLEMLDWIRPQLSAKAAAFEAKMLLSFSPTPVRDEKISRLLDSLLRDHPKGRRATRRDEAIRALVLHKYTRVTWREIATALAPANADRNAIDELIETLKNLVRKLNRKIQENTSRAA